MGCIRIRLPVIAIFEFPFNLNPAFLMVYIKNSLTMTELKSRVAPHRKCGGHCVSYEAVVYGRGRARARAHADAC